MAANKRLFAAFFICLCLNLSLAGTQHGFKLQVDQVAGLRLVCSDCVQVAVFVELSRATYNVACDSNGRQRISIEVRNGSLAARNRAGH